MRWEPLRGFLCRARLVRCSCATRQRERESGAGTKLSTTRSLRGVACGERPPPRRLPRASVTADGVFTWPRDACTMRTPPPRPPSLFSETSRVGRWLETRAFEKKKQTRERERDRLCPASRTGVTFGKKCPGDGAKRGVPFRKTRFAVPPGMKAPRRYRISLSLSLSVWKNGLCERSRFAARVRRRPRLGARGGLRFRERPSVRRLKRDGGRVRKRASGARTVGARL